MKTKKLLIAALLMLTGLSTWAAWVHTVTIANETALAANKTYTINLNKTPTQSGIDRLSAQAVYSISGSTTSYAGNVTMQWLGSNDGINYNPVGVSSVTYTAAAATTTATSSLWDFGWVNYHYLQLNVVAPSGGALNLVVTVDERN